MPCVPDPEHHRRSPALQATSKGSSGSTTDLQSTFVGSSLQCFFVGSSLQSSFVGSSLKNSNLLCSNLDPPHFLAGLMSRFAVGPPGHVTTLVGLTNEWKLNTDKKTN
ncbi:hypothetical protein CHARACLAT_003535 [Characodon lateralis]|uniref:Uncharacterized protein n=1 Tax=Characodon lateralis TaxID=208331 RepID=A0ABU7CUH0_9TELE|nr:hypothetical protein [Characodon lateralis]